MYRNFHKPSAIKPGSFPLIGCFSRPNYPFCIIMLPGFGYQVIGQLFFLLVLWAVLKWLVNGERHP